MEKYSTLDLAQGLCMGPVGEFKVLGFVQTNFSNNLYKGFVQKVCSWFCSNDFIKGFVLIWRKVRAVSVCVLPLYGATRRVQSSSVGVQTAAPQK